MFAASIILGEGGLNKILMILSSFVHLSRPFIAWIVKYFVWSHYLPSHISTVNSLINLLYIHPTTPIVYKNSPVAQHNFGIMMLIYSLYVFVCVCIHTHTHTHILCSFWHANLGKCHRFANSILECTSTIFNQYSQKIYSICNWCDIIDKTHNIKPFMVTKYNQEVILVINYMVEIA